MKGPALIVALVALAPQAQGGFVIGEKSFFDFVPHTLIDFETRADGTDPFFGAGPTEIVHMPETEYAPFGFQFSEASDVGWIKVHRDGVQDVLASGGSPEIFAGVGSGDEAVIEFLVPVRAFGLFALSERLAFFPFPPPSGLRVFDTEGNLLDEFLLEGDLLDGQIGFFEFGFMGYASDVDIGRVEVVRNTVFGIDDLFFSAVPAPGGAAVMALGALGAGRRRQR